MSRALARAVFAARRPRPALVLARAVFIARRSRLALALAAALVAGGCSGARDCRDGTLFLDVTLDAASAAADQLAVAVAWAGTTVTAMGAHTPGSARGTVEVAFAHGYPAGQSLTLTVTASAGGAAVGQGSAGPFAAGARCSAVAVEVRGVVGGDLGPSPGLAFAPGVAYPTSVAASYVAVGDVNGDGHLDIVAVSTDGNVVALLNQGHGTFGSPLVSRFPDLAPMAIALADIDGNHALDVVVGDFRVRPSGANATLRVLAGDGHGAFSERGNLQLASGPNAVAAADLDLDGDLDVVVATGGGLVYTLLNTNGVLALSSPRDTRMLNLFGLAVADFNGDRLPDLALTVYGASMTNSVALVLLNRGGGSFADPVPYGVGQGPLWIGAGDLDGDTTVDLVALNSNSNNVSVLPDNGNGTFRPAFNYDSGGFASTAALGDFDGDGRPDLVLPRGSALTALVNDRGGRFTERRAISGQGSGIATGDLDGDGKLDLVTGDNNGCYVYLNRSH